MNYSWQFQTSAINAQCAGGKQTCRQVIAIPGKDLPAQPEINGKVIANASVIIWPAISAVG